MRSAHECTAPHFLNCKTTCCPLLATHLSLERPRYSLEIIQVVLGAGAERPDLYSAEGGEFHSGVRAFLRTLA